MKKSITIGIMIAYDFLISLIASSLDMVTTGTTLPDSPDELSFGLGFLEDVFTMFGDLLTFNVEGLPVAITVIVVYIPNIVLLLVILGFVLNRDN